MLKGALTTRSSSSSSRRSVSLFTALAVLTTLVACKGEGPIPPATPVITTVTVSLVAATIQVGQTTSASATARDQNGASISTGIVAWSSASPAVATVSSAGLVSGITPGQAQIIASAGGKQGQLSVTVTPVTVASVTLVAGEYQVVGAGTAVWVLPSVVVKDVNGAPIAGADVTFAVTAGAGTITGGSAKSNASGTATLTGWTLGATAAVNRVTASAGTVAPVTFTAIGGESTAGKTDALAGFVEFGGKLPTPGSVTYTTGGQSTTVDAFPGLVQLFVADGILETSADALIRAQGGLIFAQAPLMGYYLVGVTAGSEATFIGAVAQDSRVLLVQPSFTGFRGSRGVSPRRATSSAPPPAPTISVIDDCAGSHGTAVVATVQAAGGGVAGCVSDASTNPNRPFMDVTLQQLIKLSHANSGTDRLINLSTYGTLVIGNSGSVAYSSMTPAQQALLRGGWLGVFKGFLLAISRLPAADRKNLVLGICAGNNNAPIGTMISTIRSDPTLGPILKRNALIVGATDAADVAENDAAGDPDFVKMPNASSNVVGQTGCSFATPRALVAVQKVIAATGLSAADALYACKQAALSNSDPQRLVETEAIAKGGDIAAARATDPASASSVTGIAFTSVGTTTGAVITPAITGVTVAYSVSGTDGYFDSGRLQTDSLGRVSFGIPPGATGVVDTISVWAVISGPSVVVTHQW